MPIRYAEKNIINKTVRLSERICLCFDDRIDTVRYTYSRSVETKRSFSRDYSFLHDLAGSSRFRRGRTTRVRYDVRRGCEGSSVRQSRPCVSGERKGHRPQSQKSQETVSHRRQEFLKHKRSCASKAI